MLEESAVLAAKPEEPAGAAVKNVDGDCDCNHRDIAVLAYKIWQERGCPIGSDQEDWFRAENELKNGKGSAVGAASAE